MMGLHHRGVLQCNISMLCEAVVCLGEEMQLASYLTHVDTACRPSSNTANSKLVPMR